MTSKPVCSWGLNRNFLFILSRTLVFPRRAHVTEERQTTQSWVIRMPKQMAERGPRREKLAALRQAAPKPASSLQQISESRRKKLASKTARKK